MKPRQAKVARHRAGDHFNSADAADFARIAAIEKRIAFAARDFRLTGFDGPFQGFAIRINHRSP
jgi:hypothetical protein